MGNNPMLPVMGYEDGGEVSPGGGDPLAAVQSALKYGRSKFGLPPNFFGGSNPEQNDQDEQPTQSFAEGGMIPDGSQGQDDGDEDDAPQQASPGGGGGGLNPQAAMGYLSGAGSVGADVATAMERQVDPHGQMDPSERTVRALQAAGSPDKAFGLMQHYRQQFNAYGAFAKAALQGSGGRPPNPAAAADALNKAYSQVPDGTKLHFTPTQGGMHVQVMGGGKGQPKAQGAAPKKFAEGGVVGDDSDVDVDYETAGAKPWAGDPHAADQQEQAAQGSGSFEDRSKRLAEKQKGAMDTAMDTVFATTEGDREIGRAISGAAGAVKSFVLSIPQLLGWQSKDGQFDSVVDKGADTTLQEAQNTQGTSGDQNSVYSRGMAPGAQGTAGGGQQMPPPQYAQGMEPGAAGTYPGAQQPQPQGQGMAQQPGQPQLGDQRTPQPQPKFTDNPTRVAADWPTAHVQRVAQEAAKEYTLKDVLHEINLAFPYAGQGPQKAMARAMAIQEWNKNQVGLKKEGLHNEALAGRTHDNNDTKRDVAGINADAHIRGITAQQQAMAERAIEGRYNKMQIEEMKQNGMYERMLVQEVGKNERTAAIADPRAVRDPKRMQADSGAFTRPPAQRPSAGPAPQRPAAPQQPIKTVNGKRYMRGPNGEAVPVD